MIAPRFTALLLGALVVFSTTGVAFQEAFAYWHVGAKTDLSSVKELRTDVNTVTGPNTTAVSLGTIYWLGGDTNAPSGTVLVQPELRATSSSSQWTAAFETVAYSGGRIEFYWTNLNFGPGRTLQLDTLLDGTGKNWQYVTDKNDGTKTASKWLNSINYGTSFTRAFATFESYDYNGSHFSAMTTNINFTNYKYWSSGGTQVTPTLFAYRYSSTTTAPPTCIQSSGSTGSATISFSC
jgi:hypothetical protein